MQRPVSGTANANASVVVSDAKAWGTIGEAPALIAGMTSSHSGHGDDDDGAPLPVLGV